VSISLTSGQDPVASGGIYVELSCTAACDQAAYARISATGMKSFSDYTFAHLVQRNRRHLKVVFTPGQLVKLKAPCARGTGSPPGSSARSSTRAATSRAARRR